VCLFCGGQCGGLGDMLIAWGLPSLAYYFFKLKEKSARITNRLTGNGVPPSERGKSDSGML